MYSANIQRRKDDQVKKQLSLTPTEKLQILSQMYSTNQILKQAGKKVLDNDRTTKTR